MAKRYKENRNSNPHPSAPTVDRQEATLMGLPTELQQDLSTYLEVKDLYALRATSRHFALVVVTELSHRLAEPLQHIQVLATDDGYKCLAALTSVPEFRKYMKLVEVHNPARLFSDMKFMELTFKHERLARLNEQTTVSDVRPLINALKNLEDIPTLSRIKMYSTGLQQKCFTRYCGGKALLSKMSLGKEEQASLLNGWTSGACINPQDFNTVVAPIMSALVSSGFSRSIVDLGFMYNDSHRPEDSQVVNPQHGNWSDFGGLRKLEIASGGNMESQQLQIDINNGQLASRLLQLANQVIELSVIGCQTSSECEDRRELPTHLSKKQFQGRGKCCRVCADISSAIEATTFTNLTALTLELIALTETSLTKGILQASQDTLKYIDVENVELKNGSWLAIFQALYDMRDVKGGTLSQLYQPLNTATAVGAGAFDRNSLSLHREWDGKNRQQQLRIVLDNFKVVARYLDNHGLGYAEVAFPEGLDTYTVRPPR